MHNIERITNESLSDVLIDMKERHTEMLKWSKENQNDIGGVFGAVQNAMGETEVDTEKLTPMLGRLITHGNVFYSTHPSCSHNDKSFLMKTHKERSLERYEQDMLRDIQDGYTIYIHSILWQKSYELFGHVTDGFFMTRTAKFKWDR